jgi:hypothetical protein
VSEQITLDQLREMDADQIRQAYQDGALDEIVGRHRQLTRDDLKTMSPEQIVQARRDGRTAGLGAR